MNTECATFHLNTTDISTSTDIYTQYGSINAYRNDITWNNVSLRTILGDMYNKYDKFNIKLSAILYSQSALIPSSSSVDLNLQINIGGLNFSNCTYNVKNDTNLVTCSIGSFQLTTAARTIYFNDDNLITIEKPTTDRHNIRIYLTTINNVSPAWTNSGPAFDLYFRVYGVKD